MLSTDKAKNSAYIYFYNVQISSIVVALLSQGCALFMAINDVILKTFP